MEAVSSVGASLREWSISATPDNVPAGLARFTVANGGPADPHELVLFKTDRAIGELEQVAAANQELRGFLPEEGVKGVEFIGEIEEFEPGEVRRGVSIWSLATTSSSATSSIWTRWTSKAIPRVTSSKG